MHGELLPRHVHLTQKCRATCPALAPGHAVSRVQARFNAFVRTFKEHATDEGYKYMMLLEEVRRAEWAMAAA